jgi:predicted RNase H-like HicB family nuclease
MKAKAYNGGKIMKKYTVIIKYCDTDNIYVASVPELPGCMAHGETQTEALKEVQTAMELWIETAQEVGAYIPEPSYIPVAIVK